MSLRELEKILRSSNVASIQWKDANFHVKEILTHIHLIKYCDEELLNSEVLRIEIKYNIVEIFLKVERDI